MPDTDTFVNIAQLSQESVIHNIRFLTAHHDIIIPALKNKETNENIPVSVKASFKLPGGKEIGDQLRISKKRKDAETRAPLLIWLYLDSYDKEAKHIAQNVAFLNSSGCCNGLALDKFVTLKRMRLREARVFLLALCCDPDIYPFFVKYVFLSRTWMGSFRGSQRVIDRNCKEIMNS